MLFPHLPEVCPLTLSERDFRIDPLQLHLRGKELLPLLVYDHRTQPILFNFSLGRIDAFLAHTVNDLRALHRPFIVLETMLRALLHIAVQ